MNKHFNKSTPAMTDELKPCLAHPCDGHMKENNYDASLACSSCQFIVADESEYSALVAGRQAAIDAALEDIEGALNADGRYDSADFVRLHKGSNPLAERDARIAELERELEEARKDAKRSES